MNLIINFPFLQEPKESIPEVQTDATTAPDPLLNFFDLMDKVYGTNDEEITEGEKLEKEFQKPAFNKPKPRQLTPPPKQPVDPSKFKSIFDIEEQEVAYGPAVPSRFKNGGSKSQVKTEIKDEPIVVDKVMEAHLSKHYISGSESESESEKERSKSRSSKKHKKEHKKRHKEKKSKHSKKHKENKVSI